MKGASVADLRHKDTWRGLKFGDQKSANLKQTSSTHLQLCIMATKQKITKVFLKWSFWLGQFHHSPSWNKVMARIPLTKSSSGGVAKKGYPAIMAGDFVAEIYSTGSVLPPGNFLTSKHVSEVSPSQLGFTSFCWAQEGFLLAPADSLVTGVTWRRKA